MDPEQKMTLLKTVQDLDQLLKEYKQLQGLMIQGNGLASRALRSNLSMQLQNCKDEMVLDMVSVFVRYVTRRKEESLALLEPEKE